MHNARLDWPCSIDSRAQNGPWELSRSSFPQLRPPRGLGFLGPAAAQKGIIRLGSFTRIAGR